LEQLIATAEELNGISFSYFRAGVWKPRTRPGSFEGHGIKALPWLNEIQAQFGYKIAIEVASAIHVEQALDAGIDAFWIGARSVTNPFTVQEIADSLKGVNIPMFIKNPVNPDLKLWLGAVERIENATNTNIHAIHRGFSVYEKMKYRNDPNWQIALDFKIERPDVPLICDPSHMGGTRDVLLELSQIAMDLHFDGLHLEVHNDPIHALTDAMQQINGKELRSLLQKLKLRERNDLINDEILELRDKIDSLDKKVLHILVERMKIADQIGQLKSRMERTKREKR
jgi:chorismate mutase